MAVNELYSTIKKKMHESCNENNMLNITSAPGTTRHPCKY